jgi:hypothetical protein
VNRQERPVKTLRRRARLYVPTHGDELHLQNLIRLASICAAAILKDMAINKRLRVIFYALATLEMILLSALYSWARIAH